MKSLRLVFSVTLWLFALGGMHLAAAAQQDADSTAIAKAIQSYMDSWNTHDVHAVALLYAVDCDFVNNFGDVTHGRDGMEKTFGPFMTGPYSATVQTGTIRSVRFLKPDVAAVDVDWEMTGAKNPDGSPRPTRKGIHSLIMTRQSDGTWLITVMHVHEFTNTPRITPPGAAPATPPTTK
jgi:uncharacterized protein (TIGR02246 family)